MTDLHRFHLFACPTTATCPEIAARGKTHLGWAEDARALCAHQGRTVCIAQGRHHLSQSVAREVEISGQALMKMLLLRKLAALDTFPALKNKLWSHMWGSEKGWDSGRHRNGPSNDLLIHPKTRALLLASLPAFATRQNARGQALTGMGSFRSSAWDCQLRSCRASTCKECRVKIFHCFP